MVIGGDIPSDPDNGDFRLVRSAFGRELGLRRHLLTLVRRRWRLPCRHRSHLDDASRTPTTVRLRNAGRRHHIRPRLRAGSRNLDFLESTSLVRWYFLRVLVVFVPITLAMAVLGLVLGWTQTLGRGQAATNEATSFSLMEFPNFQTTGIVVGAYTFLAMTTGSAAALLIRNTVFAMVMTLLAFLIVPVALSATMREHYLAPDTEVQPIDGLARAAEYAPSPYENLDSRWVIGAGFADTDGNMIDADYTMCWGSDNSDRKQQDLEVDNCLREQGIDHYAVIYHPQSRYWQFQFIETAVMLLCSGLMVALALVGARGRRRRPTYNRMSEMSKSIR